MNIFPPLLIELSCISIKPDYCRVRPIYLFAARLYFHIPQGSLEAKKNIQSRKIMSNKRKIFTSLTTYKSHFYQVKYESLKSKQIDALKTTDIIYRYTV